MALTFLGNNPINIEDGWVTYNPINLRNKRTYLMELEVFASQPDLLYSSFVAKLAFPNKSATLVTLLDIYRFYYEPFRQAFEFTISSNFDNSGDAIFSVRRFAFFSNPTNLATCTVELAIDSNIFF